MRYLLSIFALAIVATSCRTTRQSDIVKETYVHKYGVPVAKQDWDAQGKEGKIVQLRKDGVTITQSMHHDMPHGETTYSFPHTEVVQYVENYREGVLVSKRENYASGVPFMEETFQDGKLIQLCQWYEEGAPALIEQYQGALLMTGEYRNSMNAIESRVVRGEGTRLHRTVDGDLIAKEVISGGEMVEKTTFYPNGDPSAVVSYSQGKIHGIRLTFLPGGIPHTMEQWVYGIQEGITVAYQNGEKVAEIPYIQGKKNGLEQRFREGTYLVEEVTWKEDMQHGPRKFYVDGDANVEWYHEGALVGRPTFERMNPPR